MPIPTGKHNDWPWPFSYVPRSWTAVKSDEKPSVLLGDPGAGHNADIPARGSWVVAWPPYVAFTTEGGLHGRVGIRYDFVDKYYQIPSFTLKRIA